MLGGRTHPYTSFHQHAAAYSIQQQVQHHCERAADSKTTASSQMRHNGLLETAAASAAWSGEVHGGSCPGGAGSRAKAEPGQRVCACRIRLGS
mmetsp:Transcript_20588/g.62000  ORF Transcript_20588/g.62000 Transcript_20588/m.62000 type:complete len:93 (-) Transcript_20588:2991-3269(-)